MKLLDCVESLSTKTLNKILEHHPPYSLDSDEGRELTFLLNSDYLRQQWNVFSPNEKVVLRFFLANPQRTMLPYSQVKENFKSYRLGEILVGLTHLRQKGFLFTHRRFHGEVSFFIPEDLRLALLKIFYSKVEEHLEDVEEDLIRPRENWIGLPIGGMPFFEELWSLLKYVWSSPITLTQKGLLHRRHIIRLEERLSLNPQAFESWRLRYEGEEAYAKPLALLLDFALHNQLVGEIDDTLVLNKPHVEEWLNYSERERRDQFLIYLQERIGPQLSHLAALSIEWLLFIPEGKWVSITLFQQFVSLIHWEKELEEEDLLQIFRPLETLGIISLEQPANNPEQLNIWIAKPLYDEQKHSRAYLQPDLHLLVPSMLPAKQRWRIAQIADLVSRDQMHTYIIRKETVERALNNGWEEGEIFSTLEELCYEVPDNVKMMLHTWIRGYGQFQFMDVMILQCRDVQLAAEVLNQPIYQPYLLGQLSDRHFIISRQHVEELRKILQQGGYSPLQQILCPGTDQPEKIPYGFSIFKLPIQVEPRIENIYPEIDEVYQGLELIQRSWIEKFRSYHIATLIDLINKSIDYDLKLTFEYKDEILKEVHPLSLQEVGGKFTLQAVKIKDQGDQAMEILIPIEEIGCIRILAPS